MKYASLILLALALTGCPMATTTSTDRRLDVPAAIELLDAAMQRRVDLTDQALKAQQDNTTLADRLRAIQAMPVSSNGPDPRIKEIQGQIQVNGALIQNNLNLLNADDTVAAMLIKSAIGEFKAGESVTITFKPWESVTTIPMQGSAITFGEVTP